MEDQIELAQAIDSIDLPFRTRYRDTLLFFKDTDTDLNPNTDAYHNPDPNPDPDANPNPDTDLNPDPYTDPNTDRNTGRNTDPDHDPDYDPDIYACYVYVCVLRVFMCVMCI